MSETVPTIHSLRHGRRETRRLEWAILLSLLVHLAVWGGYELGRREGWWEKWPVFAWLHRHAKPPEPPKPPPIAEPPPELAFLEVAQPDPVAPAKPKFYSNNNSHAANPDPDKNLDQPKLDGRQTEMVRTETAPRTQKSQTPPQPTAPPAKEQTQPAQPQPTLKPGDLEQGKPQQAQQQTEPPQLPRPRTLKEARAQLNQIQGIQSHQDGGAHQNAVVPAFDAKATPFGEYDAQLADAIQQKWDDLLDQRSFSGDCKGRVVVHFLLNYDGTITEARIVNTSVDMTWAYLCQQAITEPSPFAKWPEAMRREIGGNTREMTFTFEYY